MVFSGRPSTACLACRKRRLKCDRLPQGCSQCRRKGIKCAGYRDPSALRMRDETSRVADKFEKGEKPKNALESLALSFSFYPADGGALNKADGTSPWASFGALKYKNSGPRPALQHSVPDASIAYLLMTYTSASSFSGYLPLFCNDQMDDACSTAIFATALAAFSRHVRCAQYQDMARKEYARALTRLNPLLSNPKTAVLDRTLAAVLLLGVFETIVFEPGTEPTSWVAHVFGSLQLLRLRGPDQCKRQLSLLLLNHACSNIRMTCVQKSIPIPTDILEYEKKLCVLQGASEPSSQMTLFSQKIAEFKLKLKENPGCNLVDEALRLEQQTGILMDAAPGWMEYTVEPKDTAPAWVHRGISHRYASARVAKFWNSIRLTRFFFLHHIYDALTGRQPGFDFRDLRIPESARSFDGYVSEVLQLVRTKMIALGDEMLGSMPAFLESNELGFQRFSPAARSLIWPLAVVENTNALDRATREYASKYLDIIAGDLNIRKVGHVRSTSTSLADGFFLYHIG